jgi:hypothetical protein
VLSDVSTDAATLNHNDGVSAAIFDDLGGGTSYGSFSIDIVPFVTEVTLPLNVAALMDIQAAAGGFFSVGGKLNDIKPGERRAIFGNTASNMGGVQALILETEPLPVTVVPEPATLGLLALGVPLVLVRRGKRAGVSRAGGVL